MGHLLSFFRCQLRACRDGLGWRVQKRIQVIVDTGSPTLVLFDAQQCNCERLSCHRHCFNASQSSTFRHGISASCSDLPRMIRPVVGSSRISMAIHTRSNTSCWLTRRLSRPPPPSPPPAPPPSTHTTPPLSSRIHTAPAQARAFAVPQYRRERIAVRPVLRVHRIAPAGVRANTRARVTCTVGAGDRAAHR